MNTKIERQLKVISLDANQSCQEIEFPADSIIYGLDPLNPRRLIIGAPKSGGTVRRKVWLLSNVDDMPSHPLNELSIEAQQNEMVGMSVSYNSHPMNPPRYFVAYVETQINAATRASTTRR